MMGSTLTSTLFSFSGIQYASAGSRTVAGFSDDRSKLGRRQTLRLELLSRSLHHASHYGIDRQQRSIGFGGDFHFPFSPVAALDGVPVVRAVDGMAALIRGRCRDDRNAALNTSLTNWREQMDLLDRIRSDLFRDLAQESLCCLDHKSVTGSRSSVSLNAGGTGNFSMK